ncbi:hypothetical protein [Helicobacter sp. 23-1046]
MTDFASLSLQEVKRLFSKERVSSYENLQQHFDNFALIGAISEKLGIAEILLRNKIDFIMSQNTTLWLENLPAELESSIDKSLQKHKIISTQSLGFWLKVIDFYKIHSQLFSYDFLEDLNFKRYYERNANRFKNGVRSRRYHKAKLLVHLLRNLRNRAFHFENLYKLNEDNKPRLIASIRDEKNALCVINLETSKIQVFLEDVIGEFRKEVESGGKGSAKNGAIITQNSKNKLKG